MEDIKPCSIFNFLSEKMNIIIPAFTYVDSLVTPYLYKMIDYSDNVNYSETFETLDSPIKDYVKQHLPAFSTMHVIQPHGIVMPIEYKRNHGNNLDYPTKSSDIWVISHPKAGTTWTQEIVWHLVRGFEHEKSKKVLMDRFPLFEYDSLISPTLALMWNTVFVRESERRGMQRKILEEQEDPRLIKSHLHYPLLPRDVNRNGSKVVYIMRDPRDVCISMYFHSQRLLNYTGDLDNFIKIFQHGAWVYSPFWPHVLGYWEASKKSQNVLLLRYEDLKEDLPANIRKIADFLGLSPSEERVAKIADYLSFDSMKDNPVTNNETMTEHPYMRKDIKFCRKGVVGDHKNHFTAKHLLQFKEWTEKCLGDSDFPYYRD